MRAWKAMPASTPYRANSTRVAPWWTARRRRQSRQPLEGRSDPAQGSADDSGSAEAILWAALLAAGPGGVPIADLVAATGKGRTWVYERLRRYAAAGKATQTRRGHWRATGPAEGQPDR